MSLTFPRTDIMSFCAFAPGTAPLRLVSRQELSSREASGKTYAKDFGPALWIGSWTTVLLTNEDAIAFEAMLYSLKAGICGSRIRDFTPMGYSTIPVRLTLLGPTISLCRSKAYRLHSSWR